MSIALPIVLEELVKIFAWGCHTFGDKICLNLFHLRSALRWQYADLSYGCANADSKELQDRKRAALLSMDETNPIRPERALSVAPGVIQI